MNNKTGLYQLNGSGACVCADCITGYLETNPEMRRADWIDATIGSLDSEHCDACDCVPAAEGRAIVCQPTKD